MRKNTIDIITLGCSKNLVDSERLIRQLELNGYKTSIIIMKNLLVLCIRMSDIPTSVIVLLKVVILEKATSTYVPTFRWL